MANGQGLNCPGNRMRRGPAVYNRAERGTILILFQPLAHTEPYGPNPVRFVAAAPLESLQIAGSPRAERSLGGRSPAVAGPIVDSLT